VAPAGVVEVADEEVAVLRDAHLEAQSRSGWAGTASVGSGDLGILLGEAEKAA
jgi:hypothetical protein